MELWQILGLALLAGAAIPAGGALALWVEGRPGRVGPIPQHAVIAFGGGVLVAAVALVLAPQGGSRAQFLAMMTDFLPEALALGALLNAGSSAGPLLAFLIALQNLPEGFNAFDEARERGDTAAAPLLARFAALALLGPLMAWLGFAYVQDHAAILGVVMLVAAGGILYLTFQDIAPEAHLAASGVPALGAVAGFSLGLAGHLLLG